MHRRRRYRRTTTSKQAYFVLAAMSKSNLHNARNDAVNSAGCGVREALSHKARRMKALLLHQVSQARHRQDHRSLQKYQHLHF